MEKGFRDNMSIQKGFETSHEHQIKNRQSKIANLHAVHFVD